MKPWITNDTKASIRIKDRLYKRILKTKKLQQTEIRYGEFKRHRNYINILKRCHYQ